MSPDVQTIVHEYVDRQVERFNKHDFGTHAPWLEAHAEYDRDEFVIYVTNGDGIAYHAVDDVSALDEFISKLDNADSAPEPAHEFAAILEDTQDEYDQNVMAGMGEWARGKARRQMIAQADRVRGVVSSAIRHETSIAA